MTKTKIFESEGCELVQSAVIFRSDATILCEPSVKQNDDDGIDLL